MFGVRALVEGLRLFERNRVRNILSKDLYCAILL